MNILTPEERLVSDPYDMRALVERMLCSAASGSVDEVARSVGLLRRLHGHVASLVLVEKAIIGARQSVVRRGECFYLGDAELSSKFMADIDDAIQRCAEITGDSGPIILINCTRVGEGLYLTNRDLPGLALVTISANSRRFPDGLRRVLFHEVAHGFMISGSQLLDEGFAVWFAAEYSGENAGKLRQWDTSLGPNFRALLLAAKSEGLLFQNAGVKADEVNSVRMRGAYLVGEIVRRIGTLELRKLFEAVEATTSPEEIVSAVERALGEKIEALDAPVHRKPEEAVEAIDIAASIPEAMLANEPTALDRALDVLKREEVRSANLVYQLASMHIARLEIAIYGGAKAVDDALLAKIDTLVSEAASLNMDAGRLAILRGKRCYLDSLIARPGMERANFIKVSMAAQQVSHWYAKALHFKSDDPDLLIHCGLHELFVPEKYGGGREKGRALILRAADDAHYGKWARRLLDTIDKCKPGDGKYFSGQ